MNLVSELEVALLCYIYHLDSSLGQWPGWSTCTRTTLSTETSRGWGFPTYCAIGYNTNRHCKVNILIDSRCRAHLADFGLATIVNESTSRTTTAVGRKQGTIRWMAPELLYPEKFEFTGRVMNQLPSKDTDIYAIGMTILEVSAYPSNRKHGSHLLTGHNGMRSIRQRPPKRDGYTQSCERRSARQTIFGALRCAVGPISSDMG